MKKLALLLALLMVLGGGTAMAFHGAIGEPIGDMADSTSYGIKFPGMLLDGVYHYTEVPYYLLHEPYNDMFAEGHYGTGLFTGLGKGVVHGVNRVITGTYNIVASPLPGYHGIRADYDG